VIYYYERDKSEINNLINKIKLAQNSIVFTNGCFDILHIGHLKILNESKKLGNVLILGLNSDSSIQQLKGSNRPIINEIDRSEILSNFRCVDHIIIYDDSSVYNLIDFIKPAILVKGGDYTIEQVVGNDIINSYGGQVIIIPFVHNNSTTSIIDKIYKL
jgi:D-beta-D-heptose 7-phosphate kinase/D-beta-D-heptose 1-phosphate adenosyltransferase